MKLIFFTDTHIRKTTPGNRKDDFYETLKNKFLEIKRIIEKEGIDYVLHGGDWFDRPDISPDMTEEFAAILQSFGKPVYTVAGNHDIHEQSVIIKGQTMVGLLEERGIIRLLRNADELILEKGPVKIQLTGRPWSDEIDGKNFRLYYLVKKQKGVDYAINLVHGMLLNKPFAGDVKFTLIKDITDTGADITLSGHYHTGFGVIEANSRYFVNPGSLVRVTRYTSENIRRPKVVVIELTDKIRLRELELSSALPGEIVLGREET